MEKSKSLKIENLKKRKTKNQKPGTLKNKKNQKIVKSTNRNIEKVEKSRNRKIKKLKIVTSKNPNN